MATITELALQVAITQIGQDEKPNSSNWGHPVQDYLASVGIGFPASWCMALLYWCFDHAAMQSGLPNPLFKTAGCLAQWNNRKENRVPANAPIQPGDIFIMNHGGGLGHTGIVQSVDKDGTLHTIEGNTNNNGSREGVDVEQKIRHNKPPIIGFLRFS